MEKELTINDYKKKMKSLQIRGKVFDFVCNIVILCIVVCMSASLISMFVDKRGESHTPVDISMLTAETNIVPSKQYDTLIQDGYTKNGIAYKKVTIGDYSTVRSEKQLSILGSDTACDTEIYTLTIHNNDNFFLKATIPNSITIVRYSVLGEKEFSKKEIKEYKKIAATYFTHAKYERMHYKDADKYTVAVENIAQ
jgi:hypothetical protein